MMKTLIQIVLVALIFGGLSAGGSIYLKRLNAAKVAPETTAAAPPTEEKTDEQSEMPADSDSSESTASQDESPAPTDESQPKPNPSQIKAAPVSFGPPVAARPPFNPNADEASDLIAKLRARVTKSTRQERRVAEREDLMKLILDDLSAEQVKTAKLKRQLLQEQSQTMKSIDEARKAVESERGTLYEDLAQSQRQSEEKLQSAIREKEEAVRAAEEAKKIAREQQEELQRQLEEARNPVKTNDRSGSPEQTANLKKTAETLNAMPAEDTAKILRETVKEGRTEAAVAILNAMKPRVCAKVIKVITESDQELAADLVDRLKRLKKETPPPPAPGL